MQRPHTNCKRHIITDLYRSRRCSWCCCGVLCSDKRPQRRGEPSYQVARLLPWSHDLARWCGVDCFNTHFSVFGSLVFIKQKKKTKDRNIGVGSYWRMCICLSPTPLDEPKQILTTTSNTLSFGAQHHSVRCIDLVVNVPSKGTKHDSFARRRA